MDSRTGVLLCKYACLRGEHLLPANVKCCPIREPAGEVQENSVVSKFGRAKRAVEAGKFDVGGSGGKNREALAGADLDQSRNQEAVQNLSGLSLPRQLAERISVRVLVMPI